MKFYLSILFVFVIACHGFSQPIKEGYAEIKNGKLFYTIIGTGKPLLLVNGGPGIASSSYFNIAKKLKINRKVILFDQRGVGNSTTKSIEDINFKNLIDDIERLRMHLKIEKWDVLGISFGGTYALNYISKHSGSIDKLILVASPDWTMDTKNFQSFSDFESRKIRVEEKKFVDSLKTLNVFRDSLTPIAEQLRHVLNARFYVSKSENMEAMMNFFYHAEYAGAEIVFRYFRLKSNARTKNRLERIQNSTLILHGMSDFINYEVPKKNSMTIPNSELKFLDSGHSIFLDAFDEANALIRDFLN